MYCLRHYDAGVDRVSVLVISRKANEIITIEPAHVLDSTALSKVFEHGAIEIKLIQIAGSRVTIAIHAPPELRIWRGPHRNIFELVSEGDDCESVTPAY